MFGRSRITNVEWQLEKLTEQLLTVQADLERLKRRNETREYELKKAILDELATRGPRQESQ